MTRQYALRFGIPSLDGLVSGRENIGTAALIEAEGATSLCILGPDGTGKSVLGLHLASHYLHDHVDVDDLPIVLYVSTDLSYAMANARTWIPFGLDFPGSRLIPFARGEDRRKWSNAEGKKIPLRKLRPLSEKASQRDPEEVLSSFFVEATCGERLPQVGFVDLAANTAGDDWGFINRILALLPCRKEGPLHLMIVDAVEGFETLVGDLDAYGQISSRRSRIAQIMRSAHDKCHIAFIVEEPAEGQRLPEQFVTDVVIRLRKKIIGDYARRTIEIEKARGREHVRGTHPYVIRSGRGSTTGDQENNDDPMIPSLKLRVGNGEHERELKEKLRRESTPEDYQGYVHVFSSLHHYSRSVMHKRGYALPGKPKNSFAAFGIRYLDNMLAGNVDQPLGFNVDGFENMGLPSASVTALIGDSLTQKTKLGYAFLSRCFARYPERLGRLADACERSADDVKTLFAELGVDAAGADKLINRYGPFPRKRTSDQALDVAAQMLSDSLAANEQDGFAILLTTNDIDVAHLVEAEFSRWLPLHSSFMRKYPEFAKKVEAYCLSRTICRRLEIHDLPSPILMHIVKRAIETAQAAVFGGPVPSETDDRFKRSHGIRVVIDDFGAAMASYPEIRKDALFLPTLLFHLRREGTTSLIIDTHSGQPGISQVEPLESELRALVDQRLYTWHVPFYGENRVAIAVIPPLTEAAVRELKTARIMGLAKPNTGEDTARDDDLVVDPGFELYAGLEERRPQPVPLEVHIHEETPAFRAYMERENQFYESMFAPNKSQGVARRAIIIGRSPTEYESLQDFCYLDNETRLDHTLVFEIDEFWAIRQKNALSDLSPYLRETITTRQNPSAGVDPFELFQPTLNSAEAESEQRRRFQAFPEYFTDLPDPKGSEQRATNAHPEENGRTETSERANDNEQRMELLRRRIDRVPFTWDFGFLLCRKRAWDLAAASDGMIQRCWKALRKVDDDDNSPERVEQVSWFNFLQACRNLARLESARTSTPTPAFDLSLLAPESFSCLVLEMWASNIAKPGSDLDKAVRTRDWSEPRQIGLIELLDEGGDFYNRYKAWRHGDPSVKFQGHWLALCKVWLLLGETLDLNSVVDVADTFEFNTREANPAAIASRQWYKTAGGLASNFNASDPLIAVQLPGRYSTRGDWFLAISKNSRSLRLGHRAIDLLSSRRANIKRLQMGVGLPVRDILPEGAYGYLRTSLVGPGRGGNRRTVSYKELRHIGADDSASLQWLWRSGLRDYDRHARIFQKWLHRMMILLRQLKLSFGREWVDAFEVVQLLSAAEENAAARPNLFRVCGDTLDAFMKRVEFLVVELKAASQPKRQHRTAEPRDGNAREAAALLAKGASTMP